MTHPCIDFSLFFAIPAKKYRENTMHFMVVVRQEHIIQFLYFLHVSLKQTFKHFERKAHSIKKVKQKQKWKKNKKVFKFLFISFQCVFFLCSFTKLIVYFMIFFIYFSKALWAYDIELIFVMNGRKVVVFVVAQILDKSLIEI
jgi:hypothetical protein